MDNNAGGFIEGLVFVIIAIIFGIIVLWGIENWNAYAIVIGAIGELAWFTVGLKALFGK